MQQPSSVLPARAAAPPGNRLGRGGMSAKRLARQPSSVKAVRGDARTGLEREKEARPRGPWGSPFAGALPED